MGIRKKKILYAIMVVCMIVFGIFGTSGLIGDSGRNTDDSDSASGTEEPQSEDIPVTSEDDATTEESQPEKTVLDVRLEQLVDAMTLEEKVGQLFFIKNDGRFGTEELAQYPAGGIILFAGDFRDETADSLTDKLQGFQEASTYPLLIGTDEEGGSVVRVS
ncbi:MAG: glycoside hydrolase family 3 N-terminal domain-containing protein, partial [Wujia sp.]